MLTDKVVRREPVGSVGPEVEGGPGAVQPLFFYTELRVLAETRFVYRNDAPGTQSAEAN